MISRRPAIPLAMGKGKHTALGKDGSATTYLKGDFTQMADPLGGLSGAERQQHRRLEARGRSARTAGDPFARRLALSEDRAAGREWIFLDLLLS